MSTRRGQHPSWLWCWRTVNVGRGEGHGVRYVTMSHQRCCAGDLWTATMPSAGGLSMCLIWTTSHICTPSLDTCFFSLVSCTYSREHCRGAILKSTYGHAVGNKGCRNYIAVDCHGEMCGFCPSSQVATSFRQEARLLEVGRCWGDH